MKARGIRTVIVPIDGSGGAERALPYAQLLAGRLDAEIELLAVAATPARRRRLQYPLERARAQVAEGLSEARVACDFSTVDRIVAATSPSHAVACIATSWAGFRSIARRVVFHSDGPVLLVGPQASLTPSLDGGLVAAIPDDRGDRQLIDTASSLAHDLGLPVTFLATADGPPPVRDAERASIIRIAGVDPATAILEHEHDHPVTVIAWAISEGWGRRTGRNARATSRVIRAARAPVLAVPHR